MSMINKAEIWKDLKGIWAYLVLLALVSVFFLKRIIFATHSNGSDVRSYALSVLMVTALLILGLFLRYAWRGWLVIR